jgi:ATP-dependent Zn protease
MPTKTQMFFLLLTTTVFSILSGAVFRDVIHESKEITYEEYRHIETLVEKYKGKKFIADFSAERGDYVTRRDYDSIIDCANRTYEADYINKLRGTNVENEITAFEHPPTVSIVFLGFAVLIILFAITWVGIYNLAISV